MREILSRYGLSFWVTGYRLDVLIPFKKASLLVLALIPHTWLSPDNQRICWAGAPPATFRTSRIGRYLWPSDILHGTEFEHALNGQWLILVGSGIYRRIYLHQVWLAMRGCELSFSCPLRVLRDWLVLSSPFWSPLCDEYEHVPSS